MKTPDVSVHESIRRKKFCWMKMPSRDLDVMLFHMVKSTKVFKSCAELQVLGVMMSESQVSYNCVYYNSVLHNKTNKCTYVNCIYHMFFITDKFQPLSRSSSR